MITKQNTKKGKKTKTIPTYNFLYYLMCVCMCVLNIYNISVTGPQFNIHPCLIFGHFTKGIKFNDLFLVLQVNKIFLFLDLTFLKPDHTFGLYYFCTANINIGPDRNVQNCLWT